MSDGTPKSVVGSVNNTIDDGSVNINSTSVYINIPARAIKNFVVAASAGAGVALKIAKAVKAGPIPKSIAGFTGYVGIVAITAMMSKVLISNSDSNSSNYYT